MKKNYFFYFILSFLIYAINHDTLAQTTIKKIDNEWALMVNEKTFEIKGVTFGHDQDVDNYERYFKDLKFLGVNTIRIWNANENTEKLLNMAHTYGIKVMVGIWMRHGQPGMEADDSFNYIEDAIGMDIMLANAMSIVEKHKDHPALLTWGVGNEVYLNIATDEEKKAYSMFLEKVCSNIKRLDPNHPITSVEAWTFGLDWWPQLVPSIDIYGINCYGYGANLVPEEFKKKGIDKPYIITEFGVTGEWDSVEDDNGVKIEPNDHQKYHAIATGYKEWIYNKPGCLGVYVFHYSNGNDHLSSWLFTHIRDMYRPQYWAIREAFTANKPLNYTPVVDTFYLSNQKKQSGEWASVSLQVSDIEQEELNISFYYNQRTGSRKRRDQINLLNHRGSLKDGFEIQLPKEDGAIKVYVHISDSYKNIGIGSTSIIIENTDNQANKYLVAKTTLPFYVYNDGPNMPYSPSAIMGNFEHVEVDTKNNEQILSGENALKISYNAPGDWFGVGLVDPPNDWGEILGGYDISGAKKFSFWAKADTDELITTIGFGLVGKDKPFPDSAVTSVEITLTNKWKRYSINIKKLNLSCIRSGLVVVAKGKGYRYSIWLDDIVFE